MCAAALFSRRVLPSMIIIAAPNACLVNMYVHIISLLQYRLLHKVVCIFTYVCMFIYICLQSHQLSTYRICMYVYTCVCISMCVCIYIYIDIYIYMYIYIWPYGRLTRRPVSQCSSCTLASKKYYFILRPMCTNQWYSLQTPPLFGHPTTPPHRTHDCAICCFLSTPVDCNIYHAI